MTGNPAGDLNLDADEFLSLKIARGGRNTLAMEASNNGAHYTLQSHYQYSVSTGEYRGGKLFYDQ